MTIQTKTRIFLVQFQFNGSDGAYIFENATDLMELLKIREANRDTRGIEFLKTFDYKDFKFKNISRPDFLKFVDYETEAMEYFKKHPYFKSLKF